MSDRKVRVRIRTTQTIRFDQTVEMTVEEWAELKKTPERTMDDELMSPLNELLDFTNVDTDGDYDMPELDVVGEDNKPVTPADFYIL